MELKGINGFDPFGSEKYVFNETNTKNGVVNREHLLSLGVKDSIDGVATFGMPCFRPLETIISSNFDAVELLYNNLKNELQSVLGVRKGNLCGLVNMLGVFILPLEYSNIICPINSSKSVFCVQRNSDHKWAAIDIFDKEVVPFGTYKYMWGYDHNHCLVSTVSGTFSNRAIIGIEGEILVSPGSYVDIYGFRGKQSIKVEDHSHNTLLLSVETLSEFPKSKPSSANNRCFKSIEYDYPCNEPGWGSYDEYGGYNGYDDYTIDSAFDGDPEATWNID